MKLPIKIIFSAALVAVVLASTVPAAAADHYLIADQFNNRVIEVDHRGNIVWHFGLGPADFAAIGRSCGVQGHVLGFEGRNANSRVRGRFRRIFPGAADFSQESGPCCARWPGKAGRCLSPVT